MVNERIVFFSPFPDLEGQFPYLSSHVLYHDHMLQISCHARGQLTSFHGMFLGRPLSVQVHLRHLNHYVVFILFIDEH